MTDAKIGYGSSFRVGDDSSPPVYTDIAEVTGITPPPVSRDLVEATHMKSPGGWKEFIGGLKDGGEVKIDMNFIPAGASQQLLVTMQTEDTPRPCQIEFPDGTIWGFDAFCTGFEPEVPVDDKMASSATFKVTGQPDFLIPS